jgi:hypothetical protein
MRSSMARLLCVFAFVTLTVVLAADTKPLTVFYDEKTDSFTASFVKDRDGVVIGEVSAESLFEDGWNRLFVSTNGMYSDSVQMRAVGFADGWLFQHKVWQHRFNLFSWYDAHYTPTGGFPPELWTYLSNNTAYVRQSVADNPTDPYWINVALVLSQFDGFVEGYHSVAPSNETLTSDQLWAYQSLGDMLDLVSAVSPSFRLDPAHLTARELLDKTLRADHCSGLTRLSEKNSDIFISQVAWFTMAAMSRVFKQIDLSGVKTDALKAHKLSFSSYPGFVFSFDDYMMADTGLVILETTNDVMNKSLYDACTYESVLTWMRSRVALQMATSGAEFCRSFEKQNSGSYNNQWHVLDYKRFIPGQSLSPGTFHILEQVPGLIMWDDLTPLLQKQGYFPSYNIPYFTKIYNISGYPAAKAKTGDFWSYENNPRAKIFRRNATSVNDLDAFKSLMRYNDWQVDPLSLGDAGNAPASRYDLKPEGMSRRECFGAMDAKVTNADLCSKMQIDAISSPTYDQQPVFKFSTTPFTFDHVGLPDEWKFPWMEFEWQAPQ